MERSDRSSEVRAVVIVEAVDQRMPFKRVLDDASLHTFPSTVNQAYLAKAGRVGFVDILLDDRSHVARLECVQVELSLDRNAHPLPSSS